MKGRAVTRQEASEWGCIVSGLIAVGTAIVWAFGIKSSPPSLSVLFPAITVIAAVACATLFYLGKKIPPSPSHLNSSDPNNPVTDRMLHVCSNGYPLLRTQSGIALNLQILSSIATKLVYAKATLTRREGFQGQTRQIELESNEPHIIPAMQMFNRMLERKDLALEETKRWLSPNVEIQGILKLEENDRHQIVQFQLLTHRECPKDPPAPQAPQLPTLKQKTIHLAEELLGLLRELGPEPPHPLSDKSGTVAGQQQTFDAYFEWQRKAYYSYMARFKDRVVQIDNELAAAKVFTTLDDREIDPPKHNGQVQLKKIAETLLLTAYHMPN